MMKKVFVFLGVFLIFMPNAYTQNSPTFVTNKNILEINREKLSQNDALVLSALQFLQKQGQKILSEKARSVMEKRVVPPSGDKHDFLSWAGYYWPNPLTGDGKPYIHKDGKWNPEASKIPDRSYLKKLCKDVRTLGVLYYYTKEEKYAKKASELLVVWFIEKETRMNPNLRFAQGIPGRTDGRDVGIVDTRELVDLLDGVQLLKGSKSWTKQCNDNLKEWFQKYLSWMQKNVKAGNNNIGTAYLAQTVCFSLYLNDKKMAYALFEKNIPGLLQAQFDDEGKQPLELERKDAWMYSNSNLNQWLRLLKMADEAGFDLWNYQAAGRSLSKAYYWMEAFADGKKIWKYGRKQHEDLNTSFNRIRMQVKPYLKSVVGARTTINDDVNIINDRYSLKESQHKVNKNNALLYLTEWTE